MCAVQRLSCLCSMVYACWERGADLSPTSDTPIVSDMQGKESVILQTHSIWGDAMIILYLTGLLGARYGKGTRAVTLLMVSARPLRGLVKLRRATSRVTAA
jgi:hypothetical protein